MTARIIGGLLYDLDDKPVDSKVESGFEGQPLQHLVLGDEQGSDPLSISLSTTSIERIDDLIDALQYIRDVKIRQAQINQLPEVA